MSSIKDTMSDLGSFFAKLLVVVGIAMTIVGAYNFSAENMAAIPFVGRISFFAGMNPWLFAAIGVGVYFTSFIFDREAAEEQTEDVKEAAGNVIGGVVSTVSSVLMPLLPYILLYFGGKWLWDSYQDRQEDKELEKDLERMERRMEVQAQASSRNYPGRSGSMIYTANTPPPEYS